MVTPPLPEEARADLLDQDVRRSLRGLPSSLADTIARHLVATALLLDDDPATALNHARAAADRVPRLAAVREAVGIAAYHAGEYATALLELRAARRIDGSAHNLPLMADSERGLGRADRAIAYLRDPQAESLDPAARAELLIVVSGARRDLGQPDAAVLLLRDLANVKGTPPPWAPRLWYAYAEALLAAGRDEEAARWFTSTAAIDEGETDAAARAYFITTGELLPQDEDEDLDDDPSDEDVSLEHHATSDTEDPTEDLEQDVTDEPSEDLDGEFDAEDAQESLLEDLSASDGEGFEDGDDENDGEDEDGEDGGSVAVDAPQAPAAGTRETPQAGTSGDERA